MFGKNHPSYATTLFQFGSLYENTEQWDLAENYYN